MSTHYADQVIEGMDVYDANDDKIGSVSEVYDTTSGRTSASGGGYLRVPTGFLGLGREHHIPFSAIRSVGDDRINLRVGKDELDNLGYGESPTAMDDDRADYVSGERTTTTSTTSSDLVADDTTRSATRPSDTEAERRRLQLREEELIPRKRSVQTGEVRLQTKVVSEERTVEVPVTREEVYIERHAVDLRPSDRPISETGETIEVPVHEEEVTLEKRAVVYEEVEVGKRSVQETESLDETVRREELRVDDQDKVLQNAGVGTRSSSGWSSAMPGYRTRWQQKYASQGGRWEDVEPAYEYGYGLREQPQYRGRNWSEIEPDVQRDWTRSHPNTPWDRARQSIRDTWDNATDR